jgi:hypothetical protein
LRKKARAETMRDSLANMFALCGVYFLLIWRMVDQMKCVVQRVLFCASKGDVESDRRDVGCKKERTYKDTAYNLLMYLYRNAFHEAEEKKRLSTSYSIRQGSATSKATAGVPKRSQLLHMHHRLPAYR